jgi:tellurite resistance protein TehA-like permease
MDNSAKITYPDVVVAFAVLVAFVSVAPWVFTVIDLLQSEVDPLTGVLLGLFVPVLLISLIVSMGVSARGGG